MKVIDKITYPNKKIYVGKDSTEAEVSRMEVVFIRQFRSNDPSVGYNRWPRLIGIESS